MPLRRHYVRLAGTERHETGALLQKYDLRFLQPNQGHNLQEHFIT